MASTLIVGYGNPDRQDDGLAWHILCRLAAQLGRPLPAGPEEGFMPEGLEPDLWFTLQLVPEMAEDFARYERICFVDAHTGDIPQEVYLRPVEGSAAASVFTHHLTPAACLAMVNAAYHQSPQAVLLSIRGYSFKFTRDLSEPSAALVIPALAEINDWLQSDAK